VQRNEALVVAQALAHSDAEELSAEGVAQVFAQPCGVESDHRGGKEVDGAPVAFCGDASLRFASRIVRDHGRRRRDGLVQVDRSVRQLAQDHGLSPGTVQSRLRELDAHGVRCSARPTVIDPDRLDELLSPITPPRPASSPTPSGIPRDAALEAPHSDLDGRTSRLLSLAAELTATDPAMLDVATEIAQRALTSLAEAGRAVPARPSRAAASRAVPRDSARFISEEMNEMNDEDQPSSLPSSRVGSRARARLRAHESRHSRDDGRLLDLVAPLATACDELGLPGVTNLSGLRAALEPFCDEAVAAAVSRLTVEARSGLRTPMGKLVNMARSRDGAYFAPRPLPLRSTASPPGLEPAVSERLGLDNGDSDEEEITRLPPEEVNKRVAAIRDRLSGGATTGGHG